VPELPYFQDFARAGCQVFSFSASLRECFGPAIWLGPGKYDFTELDARARRVLKAKPDGLLMPRIYLGAPDWWRQKNPGELIVFENGQTTNFDWAAGVNRTFESIASEKWRRETASALQAILEHLQQADYADHIFGYMLTGMQTEEWYHYIPTGPNLGDFSRPNTAAF
jgi:hypothetical protein